MQSRAGVRARIEHFEDRLFRDLMPEQHRAFFAKLPYVIVGTRDSKQRPWASIIAGPPGFVSSPNPQTLVVDHAPLPGDPLAGNLVQGAPIALLGIELHTRRRNRLNGTVSDCDEAGFLLRAKQSFGNCPKYIQGREATFLGEPAERTPRSPALHFSSALPERAVSLVERADTFFIASSSAHPDDATAAAAGLDVSHRGGKPNFVRVRAREGEHELSWPDFSGNFFFNTLGNLAQNPWAGLLFVDFDNGDLLSLSGQVVVEWSDPELDAFQGAERLLHFSLASGFLLENAVPLQWSPVRWSPEVLATGSWPRVDGARKG